MADVDLQFSKDLMDNIANAIISTVELKGASASAQDVGTIAAVLLKLASQCSIMMSISEPLYQQLAGVSYRAEKQATENFLKGLMN